MTRNDQKEKWSGRAFRSAGDAHVYLVWLLAHRLPEFIICSILCEYRKDEIFSRSWLNIHRNEEIGSNDFGSWLWKRNEKHRHKFLLKRADHADQWCLHWHPLKIIWSPELRFSERWILPGNVLLISMWSAVRRIRPHQYIWFPAG